MPARKKDHDDKGQFERFLEASRQICAGNTDEALERALEKVVPAKKQPKTSTKKD